jgi:pimeloyl-ACP methyl ester carboxylesterase
MSPASHAFVTDQSRRYGAIRAPTVIVSGDADRIVRADLHSRALEREIPNARLVLLPGVGHMPHLAAPDRIVAEIDALASAMAAAC